MDEIRRNLADQAPGGDITAVSHAVANTSRCEKFTAISFFSAVPALPHTSPYRRTNISRYQKFPAIRREAVRPGALPGVSLTLRPALYISAGRFFWGTP